MAYPMQSTIDHLNQKNLSWSIKWPAYLGQTFAPGVVSFVPIEGATSNFQYNFMKQGTLYGLSPYLKGTTLPKHPADPLLASESFQRFSDASVLDCADIIMGNGVDQLEQQARSIEARILRELNKQFFEGTGVAPNLKGLNNRADFTIAVGGGGILTLSLIYQARYTLKPAEDSGLGWGGNAWFSHSAAFRKFLSLLGNHSSQLEWKPHHSLGVQIPYVLGIPWYVDDNIAIVNNRSNIYALNLNHIRVLYATHCDYPANEYGLIHLPIPVQGNISEMGEQILGIYAIQSDPGNIVKLEAVKIT